MPLFICTYNNRAAFETSRDQRILGFDTRNSGTLSNLNKLDVGDHVLIRDSSSSQYLLFFGLFLVMGKITTVDSNAQRLWRDEIQDDRVLFPHRIPVEYICPINAMISKDDVVNFGWRKRYEPYNVYSWTGYTRLFAGNFLKATQEAEIIDRLNISLEYDIIPQASDVDETQSARRSPAVIYRIIRDTVRSRAIKRLHGYVCQICKQKPFVLPNGELYAEAHHIMPLGTPHRGPDASSNIICVCPNCHAMVDYGVIQLDLDSLNTDDRHVVKNGFVEYHNSRIYENSV